MDLKFKKVLSKVMPVIMLPGLMFCHSKNANAMRISDTTSPLTYICFRRAIVGLLHNTNNEDWQSAEMEESDRSIIFEFTRNNWSGQIILPRRIELLPNNLPLNISSTEGLSKKLILSNFVVGELDGKINNMSFCCDCDDKSFVMNFSYPTKKVTLSLNKNKFIKIFNVEDNEYTFSQIFALGVSLVMEFIL